MDPCQSNLPTVIDNNLLEKCIQEQGPKGHAGILLAREGIPFNELEKLRLEKLRILRIDHIWMFTGLTSLNISQNFIEKIENIEALINLKNLNLSFNKIRKIENLDSLVNLEVLSLYDNLIGTLENMDTLKKLKIFSIGKNKIEDIDNLLYLRQFKNLDCLNLSGNICTEQEDFYLFLVTFLPNLKYYEYKAVDRSEYNKGLELFSLKIRKVMEYESKTWEVKEKEEQALIQAEIHSLSFVEYLGGTELFDSMFENDDCAMFFKLSAEANECFLTFKQELTKQTHELFEFGQEQYKVRCKEVDLFLNIITKAKEKSQAESIEHVEIFMENKANLFPKVYLMQDAFKNAQRHSVHNVSIEEYVNNLNELFNMFNNNVHHTWKILMDLELNLHESMEDALEVFKQNFSLMVQYFYEQAQTYFSVMREEEMTFSENLQKIVVNIANEYAQDKDAFYFTDNLKKVISDKETINNIFAASHDLHLLKIDNREDEIVTKASKWVEDFIIKLQNEEIMRNRSKVLEINYFLDIQRDEFEDLMNMGDLFPELAAALMID